MYVYMYIVLTLSNAGDIDIVVGEKNRGKKNRVVVGGPWRRISGQPIERNFAVK